jgi:hypothetical protein
VKFCVQHGLVLIADEVYQVSHNHDLFLRPMMRGSALIDGAGSAALAIVPRVWAPCCHVGSCPCHPL